MVWKKRGKIGNHKNGSKGEIEVGRLHEVMTPVMWTQQLTNQSMI